MSLRLQQSHAKPELNHSNPPQVSTDKPKEKKWSLWRLFIPQKLITLLKHLWPGKTENTPIQARKAEPLPGGVIELDDNDTGQRELGRQDRTGGVEFIDGSAIQGQSVHFFQTSPSEGGSSVKCTFKMDGESLLRQTRHTPVDPGKFVTKVKAFSDMVNGKDRIDSHKLRLEGYAVLQDYQDVKKTMTWEVVNGKRPESDLAALDSYCKELIDRLQESVPRATKEKFTLPVAPAFEVAIVEEESWSIPQESYDLRANSHSLRTPNEVLNLNSRTLQIDDCKVSIWMPSPDTPFTLRGKVVIEAPPGQEANDGKQKILEVMTTLGIEAKPTSAETMEESYLDQIASINKLNDDEGYAHAGAMEDQQERLKEKARILSEKLKVDLSRNNPVYSPEGLYSDGRLMRLRPEIMGDPKYPMFAEHTVLTHDVYGGPHQGGSAGVLCDIIRSGGQLNSASERMIRGNKVKGQSVGSDMLSGGGDSVFTRIRTRQDAYQIDLSRKARLLFKPHLVGRLDAVSYRNDSDGNATKAHRQEWQLKTVDELLMCTAANLIGNETMIKDALSLYSDLEYIVVANERQKKEIIAAFHQQSRTTTDDGRPFEDVVVTSEQLKAPQLPEEMEQIYRTFVRTDY
ncbi:MAG: hypothetical protein ACR2PT_07460 [Endozoicomonas sp.]